MPLVMGIEAIIARCYSEMIINVESQSCDYCQVGEWNVLAIAITSNTGGKPGFTIFSRLQCLECGGMDARKWKFDPYGTIER